MVEAKKSSDSQTIKKNGRQQIKAAVVSGSGGGAVIVSDRYFAYEALLMDFTQMFCLSSIYMS